MNRSCPKVDIRISQVDGSWRVQFCLVWMSANWAHFIQSEENYPTEEAAVCDLKRRAMEHIREVDGTLNDEQVEWRTLAA